MDHFFGRLKGLFFGIAVAVCAMLCAPAMAEVCDGTTQAQAYQSCMAAVSDAIGNADPSRNARNAVCKVGDGSCASCFTNAYLGYYTQTINGVDSQYSAAGPYYFSCPGEVPPPNNCGSVPPMNGAFSGSLSVGASLCSNQGAGQASCNMTFTPDSPPFQNRAGTAWATHGTYKPDGSTCTPTGTNAPPPTAPPKSCGGESCYDAAKDQYCATDSKGGQVCVSGKDARSSGGYCASGGDTSVCAGTPNPPKPPAPPASPISDPPTETRGTDKYPQQSNSVTSAQNPGIQGNFTTNVTTYGAGTSQPSSGQSVGDDGPASSSSSGGTGDGDGKKGDGTSASGGIDCNNPPSVEGSPALAMVAMQQWQGRCAMEKALNGTSSPGDITVPSGASAWQGTVIAGDPIAAAASKGQFDQSGMGFSSTCPMHDLEVPLWDGHSIAIPFSKGCPVGEWIRAIVIAFSLLAAAKITVGSNG